MDRDPLMDLWSRVPTDNFQHEAGPPGKKQLKDIVHKSRFNLRMGLAYAALISLGELIAVPFIADNLIRIGLCFMILMNLIIAWPIPRLLQHIRRIKVSDPILPHIRQIVETMEAWWQLQLRLVWFFFPVATLFGGFFGAWIEVGSEAYTIFLQPGFLGFFLPLVAVLSWLAYKATCWMQNMTYGKDIQNWKAFLEQS